MIYFLLLILILLLYKLGKEKKNVLFYFNVACIMLILVSALRYDTGCDYSYTYLRIFNKLKLGYYYHYEILFKLLNELFIFFHCNAMMLISFCGIVTLLFIFSFLKDNIDQQYLIISLLFLLIFGIYFETLVCIRQWLAVSLFLFGVKYLKQNKYLQYFIFNIIAVGIHTTSILGFVYFFAYCFLKNKKKLIFVIYLVSVFLIFIDWRLILKCLIFLVPKRYNYLLVGILGVPKMYNISILNIIFPNVLFVISSLKRDVLIRDNKHFDLHYVGLFIYTFIYNLTFWIPGIVRIIMLFNIFQITILIYWIKNMITKKEKVIYNLLIFLVGGLTIYKYFIVATYGIVPYKSIFSLL